MVGITRSKVIFIIQLLLSGGSIQGFAEVEDSVSRVLRVWALGLGLMALGSGVQGLHDGPDM